MRRQPFYSRSGRVADTGAGTPATASPESAAVASATIPKRLPSPGPRTLWTVIALLAAGLVATLSMGLRPAPHKLTQDDIDAAVLRTLETTTLPSQAARAADVIGPSVVRVMSYVRMTPEIAKAMAARDKEKGIDGRKPPNLAGGKNSKPTGTEPEEIEHGVGSGVVIVDKGVILTNLHVIRGADRIKVTFFDGTESTASVVGVQPENDLAVLQAHTIPDDLVAATMRSTADLSPGDQVVAVGFPFGIGPSVSAGVVSGLKRSFRSPEGKQEMSNLIQFDAAANPGNSGGPLVNMDGELLGIVTAILNPTSARTFIGIGFAVPIENAASAAGMPPF
jgi:S1-C subfamily serine protease